ncbi:MAG: type II toxin-antitoxin system prevent-host-death family antitoxin [Oscillospiraceae bacterium]|nr:type II toxin-antitoxin system prevent-host-death family antitoxin [Oscillospiraceae bacterium]
MTITATEFKANFGKYIEMVAEEEFFITKNGKIVAKIINPNVSAVDSLRGMLKDVSNIDLNAEREERLAKYENYD